MAHLTKFSEKEMGEGILQSRQVKRVTIDSINKRIILKTNPFSLPQQIYLSTCKTSSNFFTTVLGQTEKSFQGENAFNDIYIIQERNESRIDWLANTAASLSPAARDAVSRREHRRLYSEVRWLPTDST